jgi:hypothetical protein
MHLYPEDYHAKTATEPRSIPVRGARQIRAFEIGRKYGRPFIPELRKAESSYGKRPGEHWGMPTPMIRFRRERTLIFRSNQRNRSNLASLAPSSRQPAMSVTRQIIRTTVNALQPLSPIVNRAWKWALRLLWWKDIWHPDFPAICRFITRHSGISAFRNAVLTCLASKLGLKSIR